MHRLYAKELVYINRKALYTASLPMDSEAFAIEITVACTNQKYTEHPDGGGGGNNQAIVYVYLYVLQKLKTDESTYVPRLSAPYI